MRAGAEKRTMRVIREPEVSALTGFSRATIWRKVKREPGFPLPFKTSVNVTVWYESEVVDWVEAKKAARP